MQAFLAVVCALLAFLSVITATPLDDYVWKKDDAYGWVDMVSSHKFHGEIFFPPGLYCLMIL